MYIVRNSTDTILDTNQNYMYCSIDMMHAQTRPNDVPGCVGCVVVAG